MIIFSEIIDIKHQHPLNKIKYVWGNLNFMQVFQVTAPVQIVETLILACVENMRGERIFEFKLQQLQSNISLNFIQRSDQRPNVHSY